MVLRSDYTIAPQRPDILTNKVGTPVLYTSDSRLIVGAAGVLYVDPGSNITAKTLGYISLYPPTPVDYSKQITVSWYVVGDGITAGSEGSFAPNLSGNTSNITAGSFGVNLGSTLVTDNTSNITVNSWGEVVLPGVRTSWVKWSDIGSLDFTIGRANIAGEMPLDWAGRVNNLRKLDGKVIAYGENGVSVLTPAGNLYGLSTIHKTGLKSRHSVAGTDFIHYFIDNTGCLYSLSDELKVLDYREYLSVMSSPVLSLDQRNNLLYICDGTYGFIYSPDSKSMGSGPVNVTGFSSQGGVDYPSAPAAITTPTFEICTDIFDFGTRKTKTVYSLEFGTDLSGQLLAAIDYRKRTNDRFQSTQWKAVDANGSVEILCRGIEFRPKAKLNNYEYFELDYITVKGVTHVR